METLLSAVNSSSALGFRKKERIGKRRNKCRTSSPLHMSDAIGTLSAEQAPSGIVSFKAKSDGGEVNFLPEVCFFC